MHIQTSDQEILRLGIGGHTCNWGAHICGLYETETERDEIVYGFLGEGLLGADREFYAVEGGPGTFREDFATFCPGCSGKISDPEVLSVLDARDLYYPDGRFSLRAMEKGLMHVFRESQSGGRRNLRSMADMGWARGAIPGVEHLMAYESRLNYMLPGKPWVTICLYNLTLFPGDVVMNVLRTHPFTISGGVVTKNPYYLAPEIWLARHAPQFR